MTYRRSVRLTLLTLLASTQCVLAQTLPTTSATTTPATTQAGVPWDALRAGHPRLLLHADEIDAIRASIGQDPFVRDLHDKLVKNAEKILTEPPVERVLIGPRLLDKSRRALDRVTLLGLLYRIDGDKRFADRALAELRAVSKFEDWNPSHFLDVAEMTTAVAIGYDWLFDVLSEDDRKLFKQAIIEKGLKPGIDQFDRQTFWTKAKHNWSQVCNGGLGIGALAVLDVEPELARRIIELGRPSFSRAMAEFAPDGGWGEGPGYWSYATLYATLYMASLDSSLGTDLGLSNAPGFDRAGDFLIQSTGPTGKVFNFADAGERVARTPQLYWLSQKFKRPVYGVFEDPRAAGSPQPLDLIWRRPAPVVKALPTDELFKGVNVAMLRSAFDDPAALYVAFKGGDNATNHSNLDLGTFVLESQNQRYAIELGGDDYNLPQYFGKLRWTYYRMRTEGQNTLVIDGQNQPANAKAEIVAFRSTPERSFGVIDLTDAYRGQVTRARRGVAMLARQGVMIQDELELTKPAEVVWQFHTRAEATVNRAVVELKQGDKSLTVRLVEPAGATWEVVGANPPEPQKQDKDLRKLVLKLPPGELKQRIVVLFAGAPDALPPVEPLDAWIDSAK